MLLVTWKPWILSAIFLALAGYGVSLIYEGFVSERYSGILTFPFVDRAAAEHAYQGLSSNAPLSDREVASQRLLQADPANPASWDAVADVEYRKAGGVMSPSTLAALDHSYAVGFFDRTGGIWRISLALENWAAIPPSLKKDVLTEAGVMLQQPVMGPQLKARLKTIRNPQGRLTAFLLMADPKAAP